MQASLLLRGGNASYTVVALPHVGEVWRGSVDANSGTLIDELVTPLKDAAATDQVDPAKAKLAEQARLPPPQAVEQAEAKSGGTGIRCQPGERQWPSSLSNAGSARR